MDERPTTDIMETNNNPSPPPGAPLTWRDTAIPLLALCLSALYWENFGLENTGFPHLGVLVLVCAHFGAVLLTLGRRARFNAGSIFCLAATLALGVSCALYASGQFLVMNCFVILLTAAMATFGLAGHLRCGSGRAVWDTICLSCIAFFTRLGAPFRALNRALRGDRKRLGMAALAMLITLPVLAVVLWLLSSADAVFGSLFAGIRLDILPERLVWNIIRTIGLALFLASALYYIREEAPAPAQWPARERRAVLFLPVTALLDVVYIIFCYIQLKYLFGGAREASMAGGWAEYARSGFFQLVAVAAINLGLCLAAADGGRFASRGGKLLRAGLGLLLALTAVILLSAFWRMRLYILAFGLSILRLLTLWAMASICFGILAAAWKLCRPGFGFFRAAGGFALALWCLMNLAGPARMIADYNVDRYLAGSLPEVDTAYLRELGCDGQAAAERLALAGESDGVVPPEQLAHRGQTWAQWSLSAYRAGQSSASSAAPIEFETGEQAGYKTILWDGRAYAPYGTLPKGRNALGAKLGYLRQDGTVMVYAAGLADTDFWLAEYTDEGWMDDPPMVYRALDAPDDAPVPDGVDSLGYDIWE